MGFSRPDIGSCRILGKDPMKEARSVQKHIGYLPGELAFMQESDLLILDEPTSGLDPLMQNRFVKLIQEEKKKVVFG